MSNSNEDQLIKKNKINSKGILTKSPIKIIDYKKFYNNTIFTDNNNSKAKIIDYQTNSKVKIQYLDNSRFEVYTRLDHLKTGSFMNTSEEYLKNKVFYTIKDADPFIIEKFNNDFCTVRFLDTTNYVGIYPTMNVKMKAIHNPYFLNKVGGYIGEGKYNYIPEIAGIWYSILERSINKNKPYIVTSNKYYNEKDIYLDDRWICYQNFADWYINIKQILNNNIIYNVDKDYMQIGKHPKIYGPDTCLIIPKKLNIFINGIYRVSKLPTGVMYSKSRKKYYIYIKKNNKRIEYFFNSADNAFIEYKKYKENTILELAEYYKSINALYEKSYSILKNINILPFNN